MKALSDGFVRIDKEHLNELHPPAQVRHYPHLFCSGYMLCDLVLAIASTSSQSQSR